MQVHIATATRFSIVGGVVLVSLSGRINSIGGLIRAIKQQIATSLSWNAFSPRLQAETTYWQIIRDHSALWQAGRKTTSHKEGRADINLLLGGFTLQLDMSFFHFDEVACSNLEGFCSCMGITCRKCEDLMNPGRRYLSGPLI